MAESVGGAVKDERVDPRLKVAADALDPFIGHEDREVSEAMAEAVLSALDAVRGDALGQEEENGQHDDGDSRTNRGAGPVQRGDAGRADVDGSDGGPGEVSGRERGLGVASASDVAPAVRGDAQEPEGERDPREVDRETVEPGESWDAGFDAGWPLGVARGKIDARRELERLREAAREVKTSLLKWATAAEREGKANLATNFRYLADRLRSALEEQGE